MIEKPFVLLLIIERSRLVESETWVRKVAKIILYFRISAKLEKERRRRRTKEEEKRWVAVDWRLYIYLLPLFQKRSYTFYLLKPKKEDSFSGPINELFFFGGPLFRLLLSCCCWCCWCLFFSGIKMNSLSQNFLTHSNTFIIIFIIIFIIFLNTFFFTNFRLAFFSLPK